MAGISTELGLLAQPDQIRTLAEKKRGNLQGSDARIVSSVELFSYCEDGERNSSVRSGNTAHPRPLGSMYMKRAKLFLGLALLAISAAAYAEGCFVCKNCYLNPDGTMTCTECEYHVECPLDP